MGKIDFELMDNLKMRKLYESLWKDNSFVKEHYIERTRIEGKKEPSKNSYSFGQSSVETLLNVFELETEEQRKNLIKKYPLACGGAGQEDKNITKLHSSSLCALLCFFDVENRPLKIAIDGEIKTFDFSTFEYRNPVIGEDSNIDVVLVSDDNKTVLFLESKFSEYYVYAGKKSNPISEKYRDIETKCSSNIYKKLEENELLVFEPTFEQREADDSGSFILKTTDDSVNYLDGIKQMISHYVGIRKRLAGETAKIERIEDRVLAAIRDDDSKIYLGEILFDGFDIADTNRSIGANTILGYYKELYKKLAEILNKDIENDVNETYGKKLRQFKVLDEELGYKRLLEDNKLQISENILRFYGIK